MKIYKIANIFAKLAEKPKKVRDLGDELKITTPLIKDLLSSMHGAKSAINSAINKLENDKNDRYPKELIETIRDFSGNLSLLCNMILNKKNYSKKEIEKSIKDEF